MTSHSFMLKQMRTIIVLTILLTFIESSFQTPIYAQIDPMPYMPKPGVMVHLSPKFTPAYLKGMVVHLEDPLKFDFIIYKGDKPLTDSQKREEYTKLTKYFLASLAIPDEDQWVNLSPYEKDRIIKDDFGKTEMGRDLLAQDYMLKQITASLIYPEDNLGKKFWNTVYAKAQQEYGTTNIPVNTFNKVWILPDDALIYEKGNTAYILRNHLRVMLEEDYLSLQKHSGITSGVIARSEATKQSLPTINSLGSKIVRQIVLPELQREVNEDKNFAALRQVYSGMLLATWFKRELKASLLGQIYVNKAKVRGVDQDPKTNEEIYRQYLRAYKKGVFNFIKEDVDKYTNETIPRKYFSGGDVSYAMASEFLKRNVVGITTDAAMGNQAEINDMPRDDVASFAMNAASAAMTSSDDKKQNEDRKRRLAWVGDFITSPNGVRLFDELQKRTDATFREQAIGFGLDEVNDETNLLDEIKEGEYTHAASAAIKQFGLNIHTHPPLSNVSPSDRDIDIFIKAPNTAFAVLCDDVLIVVNSIRKKDFNVSKYNHDGLGYDKIFELQNHADTKLFKIARDEQGKAVRIDEVPDEEWFTVVFHLEDERYNKKLNDLDGKKDEIMKTRIKETARAASEAGIEHILKAIDSRLRLALGYFFDFRNLINISDFETIRKAVHRFILSNGENVGWGLQEALNSRKHINDTMSDDSRALTQLSLLEKERDAVIEVLKEKGLSLLAESLQVSQQLQRTRGYIEKVQKGYSYHQEMMGALSSIEKVRSSSPEKRAETSQKIKETYGIVPDESYLDDPESLMLSVFGKLWTKSFEFKPIVVSQFTIPDMADINFKRGGIDLNSANLAMMIKRDGKGMVLPLAQQDLAQLSNIQGLDPVILSIRPASQSPVFSQLQTSP